MNHCEFPYGGETPFAVSALGSLGWLLAALQFLILVALLSRRGGSRKVVTGEAISWKYNTILLFAEAAAKAELASIYKARDNLLRVIESLLGNKSLIASDLGSKVAKLRAVGEPQKPAPAPSAHHAPAHPAPAHSASQEEGRTRYRPQVVVNIQSPATGGHADHSHGDAKPDPSLDDRLAEVRAAAAEFAKYWRDEKARIRELEDTRDLYSKRGDLPAELEKLRAAATDTAKAETGANGHRGLHQA